MGFVDQLINSELETTQPASPLLVFIPMSTILPTTKCQIGHNLPFFKSAVFKINILFLFRHGLYIYYIADKLSNFSQIKKRERRKTRVGKRGERV